ncbi:MAG: hypothetical protein ACK5L0_04905 [Candidatus Fimivivens sp.]
MSDATTYLGLQTPPDGDFYNIQIQNSNMQKIDTECKNINAQLASFDCGTFDDPVSAHNTTATAHSNITLDGNAIGTSTSDSLIEHEEDPNAHSNLAVDGNI